MSVKPIPDGYPAVIPYLMVPGVAAFITFLKEALDAQEIERILADDGTVRHAEIRIGDSMLMMSDANAERPAIPASFYHYVVDVDATYARALAAGATSVMEPHKTFYGDRNGAVKDAFGFTWWIATHVEDVSSEEDQRRVSAGA